MFRPLDHSVVTYRLVKCQYLFSGLLHSTMRPIWNEIMERKIIQMFSDENVFRLFCFPISLVVTVGTCSGLEYSGWSNPVFHASSSYFEPSSEFVFLHRIVPAHCSWMDSDAFMCAQRYFLNNTYFCLHRT